MFVLPEFRRRELLLFCGGLVLLVWAVFGPTLRHDFVSYDDYSYVTENLHVTHGLSATTVRWAFTQVHGGNWHPLTSLSHALDCTVWGLNPGGHHFTNVALHSLGAVLLFLALNRLTGSIQRSALVAALWAIHPQRVESVAWISERKDVLSGVFFMLTLLAYLRFVRSRSLAAFGLTFAAFVAALMSKPSVVTLPFVLLLLDLWPLKRKEGWARLVIEKLPLFVLSAASCAATLWAQTYAISQNASIPLGARASNAVVAQVLYLWQTLVPRELAPLYPFPSHAASVWQVAASFGLFAAITTVACCGRRAYPAGAVGWLWYCGMMVPMCGLVSVGAQSHADRYTYLPHIGLFIAVVWVCAAVPIRSPRMRSCAKFLALMLVVTLGWCARTQASHWKNSETLWRRELAMMTWKGRPKMGKEGALPGTHSDLGNALVKQGRLEEGISHLREAIRLQPAYVDGHFNLGAALAAAGQESEALTEYQAALRYDPRHSRAQNNLGNALLKAGKTEEAIAHFTAAIEANPEFTEAYYNLGNAYFRTGRASDALHCFERALQIDETLAESHNNLAGVLLHLGRYREAAHHFERAISLRSSYWEPRRNLAWILATASDPSIRDGSRALGLAQEAHRLSGGNDPMVLRAVAAAQAECGDYAAAAAVTNEAMKTANPLIARTLEADLALYRAERPLRTGSQVR